VRRGRRSRPRLVVQGTRRWTTEDDHWERYARELEREALPAMRATADRWAAGVTTLLGGAALSALLAGEDTFSGLSDGAATLGEVLFFAAALAAAVAGSAALLASIATTTRLFLPGASAYRAAQQAAVRRAARQLVVSRCAAALSVALLLASAAVLFFGPQAPDETGELSQLRLCQQGRGAAAPLALCAARP
jgi:hypothetical protein